VDLNRYRGQWGGKIETGEEMWWSEPDSRLSQSRYARFRFWLDPRSHIIHRFWKKVRLAGDSISTHSKNGSLEDMRSYKMVDYGCGTGGTTQNFSRFWRVPITGVDVFETQLEIARLLNQRNQGLCSFEKLDPNGQIPCPDHALDAVMSLDVLGHVPDIPRVLQEWKRALKPNGHVLLFTESDFSDSDPSLMKRLADQGYDMVRVVPEHISLFPKETLEAWIHQAGFEILERYSANVWHFFFFPKDYALLLKDSKDKFQGVRRVALIWDRLSKIFPFFPIPFHALRLIATRLLGRDALGTSYFYLLKSSTESTSPSH
jgi:SAM-dependent methyltransferase